MIGKSKKKTVASRGKYRMKCYICGMNKVRDELLILCDQCHEDTRDNSIFDTMEKYEI